MPAVAVVTAEVGKAAGVAPKREERRSDDEDCKMAAAETGGSEVKHWRTRRERGLVLD